VGSSDGGEKNYFYQRKKECSSRGQGKLKNVRLTRKE
jgi:hypothetical protein